MSPDRLVDINISDLSEFEKNKRKGKWEKYAINIATELSEGKEIVGFHIGLGAGKRRDRSVNRANAALSWGVKQQLPEGTSFYTRTVYAVAGESKFVEGWWLLFSLKPFPKPEK